MIDPFRTVHYEVTPDAEAPAGTDAGAEPASEEDAWTPPTKEEVELMNERLERLTLLEQQAAYPEPAVEEEPDEELELWDMTPDQFRNMIREEVGRTQQTQAEHEEAMARAKDVLHDVTSRDGEFLNPASEDRALARANDLLPEMAQRWGFGPKAAEAAIAKAAQQIRDEEQAIGKAYHERQVNQVASLAGARREPSGAGSGTEGAASPAGAGGTMAKWFGQGTGR